MNWLRSSSLVNSVNDSIGQPLKNDKLYALIKYINMCKVNSMAPSLWMVVDFFLQYPNSTAHVFVIDLTDFLHLNHVYKHWHKFSVKMPMVYIITWYVSPAFAVILATSPGNVSVTPIWNFFSVDPEKQMKNSKFIAKVKTIHFKTFSLLL